MTLIEITIALLILGLMVFVAVPSIEAVSGVRAREEASRIAGTIRYLYGHSALSGQVCRLTFNLEERQYWAQCTSQRFTLEMEKSRRGQRLEEKPGRSMSRTMLREEDEALRKNIEKKAEFSDFTDEQVEKRTLPDGANVTVWSSHQTERYTKGEAYLYFFPQGHTEKARIWVSSDHGDVYTLVVSPLNGRVKVVDEDLDVPRE